MRVKGNIKNISKYLSPAFIVSIERNQYQNHLLPLSSRICGQMKHMRTFRVRNVGISSTFTLLFLQGDWDRNIRVIN